MSGKPYPVLIDSGASINLCNKNILLNEPNLVKISKVETDPSIFENKQVLLRNNEKLPLCGRITIPVTIGHHTVKLAFYLIENFNYQFLLGYPTMQTLGGTICFKEKVFRINPEPQIVLHSEITIPPKTVVCAIGKIKHNPLMPSLPPGMPGLFSPKSRYNLHSNIIIPPCLSVANDHNITVQVVNTTHFPLTLHRHTPLGKFAGLSADVLVIDLADPLHRHYLNSVLQDNTPPQPKHSFTPKHSEIDLQAHSTVAPISHKINLDPCDLDNAQKQLIRDLIDHYSDVFITQDNHPQTTTAYTHKLNVKPHTLPTVGNYIRTPPKLLPVMRAIIKDYLEKGILVDSDSPFSASAMILCKPKFQNSTNISDPDEFCLVCDMRLINKHIISSFHPTERIPDILHDLKKPGKCYITCADLGMAYFQCELAPEPWKYTAFRIGNRNLCFTRLVQGCADSAYVLSRTMSKVFDNCDFKTYLDDVSYSDLDFQSHYDNTKLFFQRLRLYNLKIKW